MTRGNRQKLIVKMAKTTGKITRKEKIKCQPRC